MSRSRVSQTDPISNGEAAEPADTSFEPAAFEAAPAKSSTNGSAPDPFDPAALRLSQDFAAGLGVKKALLTVPVRGPGKTAFLRVHPDESFSVATMLLKVEGDRDGIYLVAPALWAALAAEPACAPFQLYTSIDRQGTLILWPVRLPGADGKSNQWWDSAHEAARLARRDWVRVAANMSLGAYEVWQATGELAAPDWPEKSFRELLSIAFKGKLIDALDHAVLRKLRGEV